jgi:hypothetical protein
MNTNSSDTFEAFCKGSPCSGINHATKQTEGLPCAGMTVAGRMKNDGNLENRKGKSTESYNTGGKLLS